MADQSFIQVRVENSLKQDASDVLEEIGIDMPTAVRMFLKKVVLERGIPFDTKLPEPSYVAANDVKQMTVEYIPAKPSKEIPMEEYIDLLRQVPAGQITRMEDIEKHLQKKYGVERVHVEYRALLSNPKWEGIPYWREVSSRGMLQEDRFRCSREQQKEKLESEGLRIVPCGAYNRSLKVENYKDYLFDYSTLSDNA